MINIRSCTFIEHEISIGLRRKEPAYFKYQWLTEMTPAVSTNTGKGTHETRVSLRGSAVCRFQAFFISSAGLFDASSGSFLHFTALATLTLSHFCCVATFMNWQQRVQRKQSHLVANASQCVLPVLFSWKVWDLTV